MRKKAQMQQQALIFVIAIVVAALILLFAFKSIGGLREKQRESVMVDFTEKIKSDIETLANKFGSVDQSKLFAPTGTKEVCFFDLSKTNIIVNTSLLNAYPLVLDSLAADALQNVFFISDENEIVHSMYGGNICFDGYPYYTCVEVIDGAVDLWLEGRGGCTTVVINWSQYTSNNSKNYTKYLGGYMAFLASDNQPNHGYWRDIFSILPLAIWKRKGTTSVVEQHPYATFKNDTVFDNDDIAFILDKYGSNTTTIFNPPDGIVAGIFPAPFPFEVRTDDMSHYLEYWDFFDTIVVLDYNNNRSAVIGSIFAAYLNAPLLFVDVNNLDQYEDIIKGNRVYVIDELDSYTSDYVLVYAKGGPIYIIREVILLGFEQIESPFKKLFSEMVPIK